MSHRKSHRRKPPKTKACDGKMAYTEEEAGERASQRSRSTGGLYSAYMCLHGCRLTDGSKAWHIGHTFFK